MARYFQTLMIWLCESADLSCAFDDFVDLSVVVFSIAISNIKRSWITIDFSELRSEIVN